MFRTFRSPSILLVGSLFALALAGCGDDAASTRTDDEYQAPRDPHYYVNATYRRVLTDTPTYGYYPTEPRLSIEVQIEDAAVASEHPGFDGYEQAFALVPRADGETTRWDRIALRYTGPTLHGYYAQHRFDVHETEDVRLSEADLASLLEHGLAIGFDTNVGTIWAQEPGKNFPVEALPH